MEGVERKERKKKKRKRHHFTVRVCNGYGGDLQIYSDWVHF